MRYQCPICGKTIPSNTTELDGKVRINAPFFPFCSQRCRLIDLGAWLDGRYAIPVQNNVTAESKPDSVNNHPAKISIEPPQEDKEDLD